jgi:hypothetical protein
MAGAEIGTGLLCIFLRRTSTIDMARVIRTREEVARILEDFVSSRGNAWAWDDFLCFAMEDDELESVRARCVGLDSEFPAIERGYFCGPDGLEIIRGYVKQLRAPRP